MSLDILIKNGYKTNKLKEIIKATVLNGRNAYLDFSGLVIIDEEEYKERFSEFLNNMEALKRVQIKGASPGIKRSLYIVINPQGRENEIS